MIFSIRTFGDPVLRQRAQEVEEVDDGVRKLMDDLAETMEESAGVGLAAPQIGVSRRVIVWRYEDEGGGLANPRILQSDGEAQAEEACLSIPGLAYPVTRAERVVVEGMDRDGNLAHLESEGWVARVLQHEIDHLDGVLFIDRLPPELLKEAKRKLREQVFQGSAPPAATPAL